ncbi:MAG: hypothetical protein LBH07_09030 [Treponema sp.]|jgi:hypothetical protein|nr:hypothetical protein [Treponema sp.]
MKNICKIFGIIMFIMVIGFTMTGCKNSTGGGGDGITYGPIELGEDPTLSSGQQVYTVSFPNNNSVLYTPYAGANLTVKAYSSDVGTITDGKLSLNLGIPSDGALAVLNSTNLNNAMHNNYNNCAASPDTVKFVRIYSFGTDAIQSSGLRRENTSVTNASFTVQEMFYFYVAEDVTISGVANTKVIDSINTTFNAFSLALKKGWNTVCETEIGGGTTATRSLSLSNPSSLKWVLEPDL